MISKPEALKRLSKNLKVKQEILGISQGEVARAVLGKDDISTRNKVSRWFLGKVLPSTFEMFNLAEFFDCSIDSFFQKTKRGKKVS